ncbi:MAG: hypothetical protein LBV45_03430 [Xanthomonadaceae bacterium]|jgi:hypothetical protein|nr:hypothetical protein [Xanthomonadaceae bacterium]
MRRIKSITKDTSFKVAVSAAFAQRMKKTIMATLILAVVAPPLASAQSIPDARSYPLPAIVFWSHYMKADSDLSHQVSQYADKHKLRGFPNSYSRVLSNTTTLNGVTVYTASPNDVLCGAPVGAIAMLSIYIFAKEEDLLSLPEVQAHRSRVSALERDARDRAARSTQQQESILRNAQSGYESEGQKYVAQIYQQQLAGSLSQRAQAQSREAAVTKYASTINSGFAQMSMKERCVWAMGVFIAQNAKSLDNIVVSAQKQEAERVQSSSLGFGGSTRPQSTLPFDVLVATNTVKVAISLEHQAFQLGSGTASSPVSTNDISNAGP